MSEFITVSLRNEARKALRIYAAMNELELSDALLDALRIAAASRGQTIGFKPATEMV